MLRTFTRSGANLLALINDVLDFSRIEAGKVELNSSRITLSELFEDVLGQFELRAKQSGVSIRDAFHCGLSLPLGR